MTPGAAFQPLLDRLRKEGFAIGVDQILRIERLLQGAGSEVAPPNLKYLLGPLLASSAEQQERFEAIFDATFGLSRTPELPLPPPPPPPPPPSWLRRVLLTSACVIAAGAGLWFAVERLDPWPPPLPLPAAPRPPEPPSVTGGSAANGVVGSPVKVTGTAQSRGAGNRAITYRWEFTARPPGSRAAFQNPALPVAEFVPDLPGTYIAVLTASDRLTTNRSAAVPINVSPAVRTPTFDIVFEWDPQVYSLDFRYAWYLIPPLALAAALLFRRYWERRAILERARKEDLGRPHEIRTLQLPEDATADARFRSAVHTLRRPFLGPPRLDIGKSIRATIRAAGDPQLVYAPALRRAEYLILIDTLAKRDHQSEHFQETVRNLWKPGGLHMQVYLFAGDPRVCWPMPLPGAPPRSAGRSVALSDLAAKAAGARLIFFGDGAQLLHEGRGARLQAWTEIFREWPERSVFTPKRPEEWSLDEQALNTQGGFLVLPAGPTSFQAFLDSQRLAEATFRFFEPDWQYTSAAELRDHFADDKDLFRWLCACSLYPRLEWTLTIRLGRALGIAFDDRRLLRLIRLPWFRHGQFPPELQDALYEEMTIGERQRARRTLLRLLEQAEAAGTGTVSGFEIAVLRLDLPPGERRQLRRDMAVARVPLRQGKDVAARLSLPRRLDSLLFAGSRWLRVNTRTLGWLLGAMALCAAIGFIGTVDLDARIGYRYLGPRERSEGTAGQERVNPKDGLPYMYIPPGRFTMGCSPGDTECYPDENPAHPVQITRGFWMGKTEVTQAAYARVTGKRPSNFKGDNLPVEQVSWDEASAYCQQVGLRLPTEAEWEYAARAGSTVARYGPLDRVAWYDGNSKNSTHPVATKEPNAWGLHDMLGSVYEWVGDWYDENYYRQRVERDPGGPARTPKGSRVLRGGSWNDSPVYVRVSLRGRNEPADRVSDIGFRCAGELP